MPVMILNTRTIVKVLPGTNNGSVVDMDHYDLHRARGYCRRVCEDCRIVINALGVSVCHSNLFHAFTISPLCNYLSLM